MPDTAGFDRMSGSDFSDPLISSVGLPGLEPGTSSLSVKRSNRLSYSPVSTSKTLPDGGAITKSRRLSSPRGS
ncbi:hypothetical protein MICRO8M_60244 [Microbacterium sp. 8M]|nr:hypothetical protein MICRO8M_60244 [Microbacterium sp. 8M]